MKKAVCSLLAASFASAAAITSCAHAQTFPAPPSLASAPGAAAFSRGTAGAASLLDVIKDLPPHATSNDSWWFTGYFTAEGQKIGYVYHVLTAPTPMGPALMQNISITNTTTGKTYSESQVYPIGKAASVDPKSLNILTPTSSLKGTFDDMSVVANTPGGKFDLRFRASSPAMFNAATGVFPFFGGATAEYSVPLLATTGTLTFEGKTYSVQGASWFDRQWGVANPAAAAPPPGPGAMPAMKWVWFGINLSDGGALSVWSYRDPTNGQDREFATVLHKDGSQTVAAAEVTQNGGKTWTSPATGLKFPVSWTIRIPQLDTQLTVDANPADQEIVAPSLGGLYEGVSNVTGAVKGQPTAGVARLELVGAWK